MESEQFPQEYKDYIRQSLKSWAEVKDEDFEHIKFHSYSNSVYKVTSKTDIKPKSLIFRVFHPLFFGQPRAAFGYISQEKESYIFTELSKSKYGPECYAGNEKYRLEEYLDSDKIPSDAINKPEIRRSFVRWIAHFNKLEWKDLEKGGLAYHKYYTSINLKETTDALEAKKGSPEVDSKIEEIKSMYTQEILDFLQKTHPKETVLLHGDLNYANILIDKSTGFVKLIDYERACPSLRGDDIGCFIFYGLLEAYHGDLRYSPEYYPSEEVLRELAEYYVVFSDLDKEVSTSVHEKLIKDDQEFRKHVESTYKAEEYESRVRELVMNIKISIMNFSYCNAYGCVKFNFIPDATKMLTYLHACYTFFNKIHTELVKEA